MPGPELSRHVLPETVEPVTEFNSDLEKLVADMFETMYAASGVGLAAPQIGIARAAASVQPVGDAPAIVLLNPRITDRSEETDEQYEGCLSFFDVRGMVPRPLAIEVEHQDIDGTRRITTFERGMARLVYHEVDHLFGVLYRARMRPGVELIPVSKYTGTGQQWNYR